MALDVPIRGGTDVAADTDTTLLTQTTGKDGSVFVKAVNRGTTTANCRVAIRPLGASIADGHYDLYDFALPAKDRLQIGPFTLLGTDVVTVRSSSTDVTFRYDGWEEA
jgi:hypothetical protein